MRSFVLESVDSANTNPSACSMGINLRRCPLRGARNRIASGLLFLTLAANASALDVLVNQVGYESNGPKVFRAQRATDYASNGTFSLIRVSDGATVFSGTLTRKGGLWNKFYWEGDFGAYATPGNFYISGNVNGEVGSSYQFTLSNDELLNQTGWLTYQYFLTQRCGVAVPGWHGVCHADDGVRSGPYMHMDAVGGWHDAGDYGKFPHGFAGDGLFGTLWLYDTNRSYFDSIDTDANTIPDIIDEALYQARWLVKMVDPSGHVLQQTRMNRSGSSFVAPEVDTNNVICNCNSASSCDACDDRWIDNGTELTPQEMTVCAGLIKMHQVLASKGLPTENFAAKALSTWNHRVALALSEGGHNNLGNGAMQIWAGLDLFAVYAQQDCYDRALSRVSEMATGSINNPAFYDWIGYGEPPGYELGVMAWFARTYPATYPANDARTAVQALMAHNITYLANDPIGLIRRDDNGTLQYFPSDPNFDAFFLGLNRLYLLMTWAGIESYRTIGDASYLRFALDQYNWVMGANYDRVCMMDEAGDFNLTKYHHRYYKIPGHEDGAQPGVVPNGYVRVYATGLPNVDLSTNLSQLARYQSNEGWLINNSAYAMAVAAMNVFRGLAAPQQAPYGASPVSVPGTIQAENYDFGGQDVAYHDNASRNQGGQYRQDSADIEATTDTGGGYNVGWIDAGEWLEYTVNVATAGDYSLRMRVASGGSGGALHFQRNGVDITSVRSFASTAGWQNWTTVIIPGVPLPAGNNQILRVAVDSGGWNLNSVDVAFGGSDVVSVDLDVTDTNDGMNRASVGDGNTTPTSIGGHYCRRNTNPNVDFYTYFQVSDAYAFNGSRNIVDVTLDYYDTGTGSLTFQYDGSSAPYTNGPSVTLTNTNTWKFATFHVTDAWFGNRQNSGADFRIAAPVGLTFYLDTVQVFGQLGAVPGAPTVTAPSNGATITTVTPTITWTGDAHDQYQVRISQQNDANTSTNGWDSGTVTSSGNSAVSGTLRNYSIYYAFVRLHNAGGWGGWSAAGYKFSVNTNSGLGTIYLADSLPTSNLWQVYDTGSFENGSGITSTIVSDGGSNVWQLFDNSTINRCKEKYTNGMNVSFDTGASVAARMRATGVGGTPTYNLGISNGVVGGMFLRLYTNEVRLVDINGTNNGSYALDATVYHKYQLTVKNATAGNNGTATWRVYVDGTLRITFTGAGVDNGYDGFMAGHAGTTATGTWWFDWIGARADGEFAPSQWDPVN